MEKPVFTEVVVVGGGQMGRGIAQVALQVGHRVHLVDANASLAEAAAQKVRAALQRASAKGRLDAATLASSLERLSAAKSLAQAAEALGGVDATGSRFVMVEAASESLPVKEAIFAEASACLPAATIFASNTSSISITRLAAQTARPEQVVGVHFMNPVPVMKLVEVIPAVQTSDASFELAKDFVVGLRKEVVVAKDSPAFLVNRLLMPMLNEACFALQEGLGSLADIDKAVRLGLNHPMGPFELADFVGLDTVLAIAEVLQRDFGDPKYRPASLLRRLVDAGWLGKKSGRGFYHYDAQGKICGTSDF